MLRSNTSTLTINKFGTRFCDIRPTVEELHVGKTLGLVMKIFAKAEDNSMHNVSNDKRLNFWESSVVCTQQEMTRVISFFKSLVGGYLVSRLLMSIETRCHIIRKYLDNSCVRTYWNAMVALILYLIGIRSSYKECEREKDRDK